MSEHRFGGSREKAKLSTLLLQRKIPPQGNSIAGVAQLAEQLICNQQVVGSSPITGSTTKQFNMGRFQSGQMDQTVNLTSSTSVVRIHLCPPQKGHTKRYVLFVCAGCLLETPCTRWFVRRASANVDVFLL